MGANGGTGLDGGDITATYNGLATTGDHSVGLVIQSIGAGGGQASALGVDNFNVTLGGTGGASGDGGAIDAANTGVISTTGLGSHGLFLQSIGGGGGAAFGGNSLPAVTLRSGNIGDGGGIEFTQTGDIVVTGLNAYGVIAQSLGGGGGWVDGGFAGTAGGVGGGGEIDLDINGQVRALSAGGVAILAQSLGSLGGGDITLDANALIRGADIGVRFDGGANNLITTSSSISAISARAIETGSGNDQVQNNGLVVGNIDLGAGANVFNTGTNGAFIAYSTIDLRDGAGSTGIFNNRGEFLMGLSASPYPIDLAAGATFANVDGVGTPATNLLYGSRVINTVELDGNFVQTDTGRLSFDVAFGPYASDRVNVTGDATVDGTGDVILTWLENSAPLPLFATVGTGFDNGLEITDTLAMDYSILANGDGVNLTFDSNFGQPFLNKNGQALGGHMDSALEVGDSGGIGRLMALLGNMQAGEEDAYSAIFRELNPEPFTAPLHAQYAAAVGFSRQIFGCSVAGAPLDGPCAWAHLEGGDFDRRGDFENFAVVEVGRQQIAGGFEKPLQGPWSLAGAMRYDDLGRFEIDQGRAVAGGQGFQFGLGLRRTGEHAELGFSLTGGRQSMDMMRQVNVFEPLVGTSHPKASYLQLGGRASRTFTSGRLFARPALDVTITQLRQGRFEEEGLAGLGVVGDSATQTLSAVSPELGLGIMLRDDGDARTALTFTIGGTLRSDDAIEAPYRLVGANPDADPAMISTPFGGNGFRYGIDLSASVTDRLSLKIGAGVETAGGTRAETAGVNAKLKF